MLFTALAPVLQPVLVPPAHAIGHTMIPDMAAYASYMPATSYMPDTALYMPGGGMTLEPPLLDSYPPALVGMIELTFLTGLIASFVISNMVASNTLPAPTSKPVAVPEALSLIHI